MGAFVFPIATIAAFDKTTIGSRWPTQRLALFGSELNRLAVSTSWLMQSETADVSTKKSIILKGEFAPPVSWTTRVEVPQQSEHTASGEESVQANWNCQIFWSDSILVSLL